MHDMQTKVAIAATSPPRKTTLFPPPGTITLCLVIIGVFIGQMITGERRWIEAAGADYTRVTDLFPLTRIGAGQSIPVWLTLFTYMFLHGHWWHALSNTIVVWCVGTMAETAWGTSRFLLAYLACGVVGALGNGLVCPGDLNPAFGASLAYCGVYGAYAALRRSPLLRRGRALPLLALEVVVVIAVAAWFGFRASPTDLEKSLMYHFIPFMAGWFSVRIWTGFRKPHSDEPLPADSPLVAGCARRGAAPSSSSSSRCSRTSTVWRICGWTISCRGL
jgi:membrane associated rhomboid family serine protease